MAQGPRNRIRDLLLLYDNKKYDIAVLMYKNEDEYKLLDYLYGCEGCTEKDFIHNNCKYIMQILRKKKVI